MATAHRKPKARQTLGLAILMCRDAAPRRTTMQVDSVGRFLMMRIAGGRATLVVVQNFFEELKARVPN